MLIADYLGQILCDTIRVWIQAMYKTSTQFTHVLRQSTSRPDPVSDPECDSVGVSLIGGD